MFTHSNERDVKVLQASVSYYAGKRALDMFASRNAVRAQRRGLDALKNDFRHIF